MKKKRVEAYLIPFLCYMLLTSNFRTFFFTFYIVVQKLKKYWSFLKQKSNKWKYIFTKIHSQENTNDGVFFSAVAGSSTHSFTKKGLHLRSFLVKFVTKFYRISFLQKTSLQVLLISINILDRLLVLLAING